MTGPSRIVPRMKKLLLTLGFLLLGAAPAFAQSSEFGVLFGGSRRFIDSAPAASGTTLTDEGFSFSNSVVDLYYGVEVDPGTRFRLKVGRIETPVAFAEREGATRVRRDVRNGEVQHVEGLVDYRFSEAFGSTGLFGGVGLYRQQAEGFSSTTSYGFTGGINADFPLSRRYGVITEVSYHWTRQDFRPRYLTVTAGLRIGM